MAMSIGVGEGVAGGLQASLVEQKFVSLPS